MMPIFTAMKMSSILASIERLNSTGKSWDNLTVDRFQNESSDLLLQDAGAEEDFGPRTPLWMEIMTILSHWLLILNSSCNILIYLQKDPKFKAVCWEMILTCLR